MKYIRKQVVVLAEQYDDTNDSIDAIVKLSPEDRDKIQWARIGHSTLRILINEQYLDVPLGHWVVNDSGEFKVLSEDDFKEYEPTGI